MVCCRDPGQTACCSRKQGVCTAGTWSVIVFLIALIFLLIAISFPPIIQHAVNSALCDQVCIPSSTAAEWQINNWMSNSNRTANPEELIRVYVYNITNADDMQNYGVLPNITMLGPYVYQRNRAKYNVEWSADNNQVSYENFDQYIFRPDLSVGDESEWFVTINMAFVGAVQSGVQLGLSMISILNAQCGQHDWHNGQSQQACLFQRRTIHEMFFGMFEQIINFANVFLFSGQLNPNFQFLFNCSSTTPQIDPSTNQTIGSECHELNTVQANYGFGGSCTPNLKALSSLVLPCVWNDTLDFRSTQNTGHSNMADSTQFLKYMGNVSIDRVWNSSFTYFDPSVNTTVTGNSPLLVQGHDLTQFPPGLSRDAELSLWTDLILRAVDLKYLRDVSDQGVSMYRFVLDDSVYGNRDPYFWGGPDKYAGFLNLSGVPAVRYGAAVPMFASRPYQWHADARVRDGVMYHCSNCPTVEDVDSRSIDQVDSFLDIEPVTGKVLRGQFRAQVNAEIGQPALFNTSDDSLYTMIPHVYVPVFWLDDGASMTASQAELVRNGLSQIEDAHSVQLWALIIGIVMGVLLMALSVSLVYHFYRIGGWQLCCKKRDTTGESIHLLTNERRTRQERQQAKQYGEA